MFVDINNMISISEANQDFSKIAQMVDEKGPVVILKNNRPKYLLIDYQTINEKVTLPDDAILEISRNLIEKNREAYKVLAQ